MKTYELMKDFQEKYGEEAAQDLLNFLRVYRNEVIDEVYENLDFNKN